MVFFSVETPKRLADEEIKKRDTAESKNMFVGTGVSTVRKTMGKEKRMINRETSLDR